jgi:hypothetical protein
MPENQSNQLSFSRPDGHIVVPLCPAKGLASGWAEAIAQQDCFRPFRVIKKIIVFYLYLP